MAALQFEFDVVQEGFVDKSMKLLMSERSR